jgi:putative ABC transport system permease protein
VESQENLPATSKYARSRQIEAHAVEGDYFTIKKLDLSDGRVFSQQEAELGSPVVVIGDEVASYYFEGLNPIGRELRIGGMPYTVIGVIQHQGSLFGQSMDATAMPPSARPCTGSPIRAATSTG